MLHAVDEGIQVRAELPVGHHRDVELLRVRQGADADGHVPRMGTSGKSSRIGAPAKYNGTGGPGTSVTYAFISRWYGM